MTRDEVQRLIDDGWAVVPIAAGEKAANDPGWLQKAREKRYTADDFAAGSNVGAVPGAPSGDRVDVDLDTPEAVAAARALLPKTGLLHGRPSRPSTHWWFHVPGAVARSYKDPVLPDLKRQGLVPGDSKDGLLEIRAGSGQTVLPPSVYGKGATAETLAWERAGQPMALDVATLERSVALVAIAALLARYWPRGSGSRHAIALATAGFLGRHLPDDRLVEEIIRTAVTFAGDEEVELRCTAVRDTLEKLKTEGAKVTGGPRFKEEFPHGDKIAPRLLDWLGVEGANVLEEMNAMHFVARIGADEVIGREDGRRVVFQTREDLTLRYENKRVQVGTDKQGNAVYETHDKFWRKHAGRREFERVVFAPPGFDPRVVRFDPARDFNLWRGFAVDPDPSPNPEARCARYLAHVREVICGGDYHVADWLLDWMANGVQRPGRQAEVAIAMRGEKGAGKGFFVRPLMSLFGEEHAIQIDKAEHLTGKFNAQLSAKVVVFGDEAIWAGNKSERGALKRLITEPTLAIERKGIDVVSEPNFVHLITATNEDWSVPAELRERRWLVLDVADRFAQDHDYFDKLETELDGGGREALLAFLLARPVKRNLRDAPKTAALVEQQDRTLDPVDRYIFEALYRGTPLMPRGREAVVHEGRRRWKDVFVGTAEWYEDFRESTRNDNVGLKPFSMKLAKRLPDWQAIDDGQRGYRLGDLRVARSHFDKATGTRRTWPSEDDHLPFDTLDAAGRRSRIEAATADVFSTAEPLTDPAAVEFVLVGRQHGGRPVYVVRTPDPDGEVVEVGEAHRDVY